jgi:hypothetical protein
MVINRNNSAAELPGSVSQLRQLTTYHLSFPFCKMDIRQLTSSVDVRIIFNDLELCLAQSNTQ